MDSNSNQNHDHVSTGNKKKSNQEPLRMRLKPVKGGRKWYSKFRYKGQMIEVTLNAWEHEMRTAQVNLGKLISDLERGINPVKTRKKIRHLKYPNPDERGLCIWKNHILPFFGDYKFKQIDQSLIEQYISQRWGRDYEGNLIAVKSTLNKEMRVLKRVMQLAQANWKLPGIKTVEPPKTMKAPLTWEQINEVGSHVTPSKKPFGKIYLWCYWVQVYTGLDTGDVLKLAPKHIDRKSGWLLITRGKTKRSFRFPICSALDKVLDWIPWPLDPMQPLAQELRAGQVNKAISRAFSACNLKGYGSKDLRRFLASQLLDSGFKMDWIGKALGHAPGSKMTQLYPSIYDNRFKDAFQKVFNDHWPAVGNMGE